MNKKDLLLGVVIGTAVGLLSQPIIANVFRAPSIALRVSIFFAFLILAPLALFVGYLLGKVVPVVYQFAKFAAVGTLNSFIDAGVLNLEIFATGIAAGIGFSVFKAISFLVAATNSYFWNKYWTFGISAHSSREEVLKFYTVTIIGGLVNIGIASFVVNVLHRPAAISPKLWANVGALIGIFAALLWNFIGYKFVVFKKPAAESPDVLAK